MHPSSALTCVMAVLFTFNLETKFETFSFVHSKDMAWAQKCRHGSREPNHTHLGDSQSSEGYYFTLQTSVQDMKSLALAIPEIFHGV